MPGAECCLFKEEMIKNIVVLEHWHWIMLLCIFLVYFQQRLLLAVVKSDMLGTAVLYFLCWRLLVKLGSYYEMVCCLFLSCCN